MPTSFTFDDSLILRSPAFPFVAPPATLDHFVATILPDPGFQEAVYVASPSLHRAMMACLNDSVTQDGKNRRTLLSAFHYYTRMTARSTPFGLFAGCSVARWATSDETDEPIEVTGSHRRVGLDSRYLQQLCDYVGSLPPIRKQLSYRSNSSLHETDDEVRYIEAVNQGDSVSYQVSAIDQSIYLQAVLGLSQNGCLYAQLIAGLAILDVSPAEASAYLDDLITCQVLISDLHPTVTGNDLLPRLREVVSTAYQATADPALVPVLNALTDAQTQLDRLQGIEQNDTQVYQMLLECLSILPVPIQESNLTHTDLFHSLQSATLPKTWQTGLLRAFSLLNRLTIRSENIQMTAFKNRFLDRYEAREVPLLVALDAETGVGYGSAQTYSGVSSLIADLPNATQKPGSATGADWCRNPDFWLRKLQTAQQTQAYSINLVESDFDTIPPADETDLPPSVSVVFRIITNNNGTHFVMPEGYGGSSSVNLLSRFGRGDAAIRSIVNRLGDQEQATNPDVIFAEVIHLPHDSIANVLRHPPVRDYEIPYLTHSSLPTAQQIPIQDLFISVRNGQLYLRSARLNARIIPRLSNAHNYQHKALPLYGFLADLQQQGLRSKLAFSWGRLTDYFSFFPRITYGNCLISPATWAMYADELTSLCGPDQIPVESAIRAFRNHRHLPRHTLLADGDHELLTDWESPLSVAGLLSAVRQDRVMLREFWPDEPGGAVVQNRSGQPMIHQFVGLLVKDTATYTGSATVIKPDFGESTVQRSFPVGSEWLYVKIYAGQQTIDWLLTNVVQPLTSAVRAEGIVDTWFFIRYADPEPHLRLRLHLRDPQHTGTLISAIRDQTQLFSGRGTIRDVVYATYVRELERYDSTLIDQSETLFGYDSQAVIDLLTYVPDEHRDPLRWLWAMRAIDQLLDAFGLSLSAKYTLMATSRDRFSQEFSVDLPLKKRMDQRYRTYRNLVETWLSVTNETDPLAPWPDLQQSLRHRYERLLELAADFRADPALETDRGILLTTRLGSFMHLLVNRVIASDQRFHELLIYDFMSRYYQSTLARRAKPEA